MIYYLYEIKNNINGKIYIGVHKTKNLDDGYMGSGKIIKDAIKKYGTENFTKTILETFDNQTDMYTKEKEVVTDEFLAREDVYNLRRGGSGGFDYINSVVSSERKSYAGKVGGYVTKNSQKRFIPQPTFDDCSMGGQKSMRIHGNRIRELARTSEVKQKLKEKFLEISHQKAEKNSQYGTMWITNGDLNKKIKKDGIIPEGWNKGRKVKHGDVA